MAPFIGKQDGKMKLQFTKCELPNTSIEIEFKVHETSDNHGDESGDEETKERESIAGVAVAGGALK